MKAKIANLIGAPWALREVIPETGKDLLQLRADISKAMACYPDLQVTPKEFVDIAVYEMTKLRLSYSIEDPSDPLIEFLMARELTIMLEFVQIAGDQKEKFFDAVVAAYRDRVISADKQYMYQHEGL